jgi:hypothetical protein
MVTITDSNLCTKTDTFTVSFTNSIANISPVNNLQVYPNPTVGEINVAINMSAASDIYLSLHSITGTEVYSSKFVQIKNRVLNLPMNDLAAGIYTLQLITGNETFTRKVVLQRKD